MERPAETQTYPKNRSYTELPRRVVLNVTDPQSYIDRVKDVINGHSADVRQVMVVGGTCTLYSEEDAKEWNKDGVYSTTKYNLAADGSFGYEDRTTYSLLAGGKVSTEHHSAVYNPKHGVFMPEIKSILKNTETPYWFESIGLDWQIEFKQVSDGDKLPILNYFEVRPIVLAYMEKVNSKYLMGDIAKFDGRESSPGKNLIVIIKEQLGKEL